MKKMLNIDRRIVRAVMKHSEWEPNGSWDRTEDEEYGSYLFVNPDVEPSDLGDITEDTEVMVCTLTEDDGDIRLGKMKEFKKEVRGEYDFIETLLEYSTIYNSIEGSIALRYTLPAIIVREDHPRLAEIQDYLYEAVEEYWRMIKDRDICFPSYQKWCEFVDETIEEAEREFPESKIFNIRKQEMELKDAIGHAAGLAMNEDADQIVGRIPGDGWQVAHNEDMGRQASMIEPKFLVHSDGVDEGHIDREEITENWELPEEIEFYGNDEFTFAKLGDKIVCMGAPDGSEPQNDIVELPNDVERLDSVLIDEEAYASAKVLFSKK